MTGGPSDGLTKLIARREALSAEVARLRSDLGGLTYEMAIRDHFRVDVLVRRAAILQERDSELAVLERLLSDPQAAGAGKCPSCGAVHSRGAVFCWQCGTPLMERVGSDAIGGGVTSGSTADNAAPARTSSSVESGAPETE